eukprot:3577700-Rhodomonas_salina.1
MRCTCVKEEEVRKTETRNPLFPDEVRETPFFPIKAQHKKPPTLESDTRNHHLCCQIQETTTFALAFKKPPSGSPLHSRDVACRRRRKGAARSPKGLAWGCAGGGGGGGGGGGERRPREGEEAARVRKEEAAGVTLQIEGPWHVTAWRAHAGARDQDRGQD